MNYTRQSFKEKKVVAVLPNNDLIYFADEDRYIEEGINASKSKKKNGFVHDEVLLTDINQTIVIWCLKDFCQNKGCVLFSLTLLCMMTIVRWSSPTFTQLELQRLRGKVNLKRKLGVRDSHFGDNFRAGVKKSRKQQRTTRFQQVCVISVFSIKVTS